MNERTEQILALLGKGAAGLDELAAALHFSRSTVRRDVLELERLGAVIRRRGAVELNVTGAKERHYHLRENEHIDGKRTIARLCLPLLEPGMSVFLDAGTTTAQLCRELTDGRRLTVITSGLETAMLLLDLGLEDLFVCGGYTRPGNPSLLGEQTVDFLRAFNADLCVLSACGLDADTVSEASVQQSYVKKTMFENSKKRILLCDSSKFGSRYKFRLAAPGDFDCIISDAPLPEDIAAACPDTRIFCPRG